MIFQLCLMLAAASTWVTPLPTEIGSDEPQISFDLNGNIVELIQIPHGLNRVVFASTYKNLENSWSDLLQLSIMSGDVQDLRLVVDPCGNACAVWKLREGNLEKIQAAVYKTANDQWSSSVDLSALSGEICITHAAMNGSGDIFVAWKEIFNNYDTFYTITFSKELEKWSKPNSERLPKMGMESFAPFLDPRKNTYLNDALKDMNVIHDLNFSH